ncbi:MAG: bifunctional diguanylate cyclase/phosphodiesterase, partial [Pseudomonadota bacterium]
MGWLGDGIGRLWRSRGGKAPSTPGKTPIDDGVGGLHVLARAEAGSATSKRLVAFGIVIGVVLLLQIIGILTIDHLVRDVADSLGPDRATAPLAEMQRWMARLAVLCITVAILAAFLLLRPALAAARRDRLALAGANAKLQYAALYDQLTGLPHRQCLTIQLEAMLIDQTRAGEDIGIVAVEVCGLERLDEQFGFATGEEVLRETALLLQRDCGPNDTLGRLDGARFAMIVDDVMDSDELVSIAARLCQIAARSVTIDGQFCRLAVRAGAVVVTSGNPELDAETVLMDASLALGTSALQASGQVDGTGVTLYTPEIRQAVSGQFDLAARLRRALEQDQIVPFFQPQVAIDTGRIVGVEALVRWLDPERGPQSPATFLPIAAEYGLMTQIDDVMRRKSLRAVRECRDAGLDVGHIGLNLTMEQLCEAGFMDRLRFDAEAVGLGPQDIAIEILESIVVDEGSDDVIQTVRRLADSGYYIELDDFGTGASGLSTLRDLVVHRVKIDRSFVRDVDRKPQLARFTSALIKLAQNMEIDVLAEGIEREEERRWLEEGGCTAIQGYMVAKPMRTSDMLDWARRTGRLNSPAPTAGASGAPSPAHPAAGSSQPASGAARP